MIDLRQGDCLEVMKELEAGSIDLIVTDPPYGMSLTPQRVTGKFKGTTILNDTSLAWASGFFKQCFSLLKKDTAMFVFCNHFCISEFIQAAREAAFEVKNLLVWDKGQFGMGGNWRPKHELILVLTKGRFVTHSNSLSTLLNFKKVHHSKAVHPTEKPTDLLKHLIEQPDYDPQVVLDPFMGSGTTGVACKALNRSFIGIELDPTYFNLAKQRIENS